MNTVSLSKVTRLWTKKWQKQRVFNNQWNLVFLSDRDFWKKEDPVPHFLRKLKFLAYWRAFSDWLLLFNSLQGSVLLIHINWGEDTTRRATITTTDTFLFHGIQIHLTMHRVTLGVPRLPLYWLVIVTIGPSQCHRFLGQGLYS